MLVNGTININSNVWGEGGAKMGLVTGSKEQYRVAIPLLNTRGAVKRFVPPLAAKTRQECCSWLTRAIDNT